MPDRQNSQELSEFLSVVDCRTEEEMRDSVLGTQVGKFFPFLKPLFPRVTGYHNPPDL